MESKSCGVLDTRFRGYDDRVWSARRFIRHCEERSDEAIQFFACAPGLLRVARNDSVQRSNKPRGNPMLTLHHLNDSRSQRILWLLEELGTPYEMKHYQRNEKTRLAPPELMDVHPLGKSPVITDGDVKIAESGAIVDYIIRRYGQESGKPAMMPAPDSAEYEAYNEWLHYSEGSAMLPLMLNLYVSRLKEAGLPLHPRIDSEISNHLGYIDGALKGREFFIGPSLTGADIQMSFVGDMAKVFEKLGPYPNLAAWLSRMHARPAFQRSIEKGGAYRFAK
jgi:glutathione S-transferase